MRAGGAAARRCGVLKDSEAVRTLRGVVRCVEEMMKAEHSVVVPLLHQAQTLPAVAAMLGEEELAGLALH